MSTAWAAESIQSTNQEPDFASILRVLYPPFTMADGDFPKYKDWQAETNLVMSYYLLAVGDCLGARAFLEYTLQTDPEHVVAIDYDLQFPDLKEQYCTRN